MFSFASICYKLQPIIRSANIVDVHSFNNATYIVFIRYVYKKSVHWTSTDLSVRGRNRALAHTHTRRPNQIIFMYFSVVFNETTGFFCVFPLCSVYTVLLYGRSTCFIYSSISRAIVIYSELRMRTQIDRFLLNYFAYNIVLIYLNILCFYACAAHSVELCMAHRKISHRALRAYGPAARGRGR